jgi:acyl carrier protein
MAECMEASSRAAVIARPSTVLPIEQDVSTTKLTSDTSSCLESGPRMKSAIGFLGSSHADVLAVITDTIQTVSSRARDAAITPDSLLLEDLALDSLDLVAVVLRLQDHYQVEIDPDAILSMKRVADLAAVLEEQLASAA